LNLLSILFDPILSRVKFSLFLDKNLIGRLALDVKEHFPFFLFEILSLGYEALEFLNEEEDVSLQSEILLGEIGYIPIMITLDER